MFLNGRNPKHLKFTPKGNEKFINFRLEKKLFEKSIGQANLNVSYKR